MTSSVSFKRSTLMAPTRSSANRTRSPVTDDTSSEAGSSQGRMSRGSSAGSIPTISERSSLLRATASSAAKHAHAPDGAQANKPAKPAGKPRPLSPNSSLTRPTGASLARAEAAKALRETLEAKAKENAPRRANPMGAGLASVHTRRSDYISKKTAVARKTTYEDDYPYPTRHRDTDDTASVDSGSSNTHHEVKSSEATSTIRSRPTSMSSDGSILGTHESEH
jgi:hypothetical protein